MLDPREVDSVRATDERIEILQRIARGETVVASATFLVDAESNLGSALGGMANMPGMDVTTPPQRKTRPAPVAPIPAAPTDKATTCRTCPG